MSRRKGYWYKENNRNIKVFFEEEYIRIYVDNKPVGFLKKPFEKMNREDELCKAFVQIIMDVGEMERGISIQNLFKK